MFETLSHTEEHSNICHIKYSDVAPEMIREWKRQLPRTNFSRHMTGLRQSIIDRNHLDHSFECEEMERTFRELLTATEFLTRETSSYITEPHLFVLTDREGTIMKLFATPQKIKQLEEINFKAGASLSLEDAGINGISFAMKMNQTVVIQGHEHDLELLSQWTCICAPIRHNDETIAFLDLSIHANKDVSFAVPILNQIVRKIEESLTKTIPPTKKAHFKTILKNYKLTQRETDVALLLIDNLSHELIAKKLFISVETIRTHSRKVYAKTNAKDRSDFIRRFLYILK